MTYDQWKAWFEEAWEFRDETIYSAQFGSNPQRIYTLNGEILANIFRQQSSDPRWLTHGVIEFEPTEKRRS